MSVALDLHYEELKCVSGSNEMRCGTVFQLLVQDFCNRNQQGQSSVQHDDRSDKASEPKAKKPKLTLLPSDSDDTDEEADTKRMPLFCQKM